MIDRLLKRIAHAISSNPHAYRLIQSAAGQGRVVKALTTMIDGASRRGRWLDVGSSVGSVTDRMGVEAVSIDVDLPPLHARRRSDPRARVVVCDATALPFRDGAFQSSLMMAVAHHLDDRAWPRALGEIARVTAGSFYFVDGIRNDRRLLSRLLWRYDRGAFPRHESELLAALGRAFHVSAVKRVTALHQVVLAVCSRSSTKRP